MALCLCVSFLLFHVFASWVVFTVHFVSIPVPCVWSGQGLSTRAWIYQPGSTQTWFAYICIYILYLCIIICLVFSLYLYQIFVFVFYLYFWWAQGSTTSALTHVSGLAVHTAHLAAFVFWHRENMKKIFWIFHTKFVCICLIISYIFMSAPAGYQW